MAPQTSPANTKKTSTPKKILGILGAVAAVIVIIQIAYPSNRLRPFTYIGRTSAGLELKEAASGQIDSSLNRKSVEISGPDVKNTLYASPRDLGIASTTDTELERTTYPWWQRVIPGSLFWPVHVTIPPPPPRVLATIESFVQEHLTELCTTKPQDATITLQASTFSVRPASNGNACNPHTFVNILADTTPSLSGPTKITLPYVITSPEVSTEQAQSLTKQLQPRFKSDISLSAAGVTQTISPELLWSWVMVAPQKKVLVATINPKLASEWLTAQFHALGAELDTTATIESLQTYIASGVPPKIITRTTGAPASSPTGPCAANQSGKLLLVSISSQHLWACNGQALENQSPITSGASGLSNVDDATPIGSWRIYSKQLNRWLNGSDANGGWHDYVQYWMPFYGGYGFHDASWQTIPFGSSQYTTLGSHGCVHLPTSMAAWIYAWAPVGTQVTITK